MLMVLGVGGSGLAECPRMGGGDIARVYHRLTSSRSESEWRAPVEDPRVLVGFGTDVLDTLPAHCKAYPAGLPVVVPPRSWRVGDGRATAVLAGRPAPSPAMLDIPCLARLLHLSAGVLRIAQRDDGRPFLFRAAGSAGGLFSLGLYVGARGVEGLADGVYWFDPVNHALARIGPPPRGEASSLVVTGIPWRTGWRYAERGFGDLYGDAGMMLANTLAVAQDAGLAARLRTVFPDAAITRLVGADRVYEFPLAIVTLADGELAISSAGAAATGTVDRHAPCEFP